jgi:hypothetical protein
MSCRSWCALAVGSAVTLGLAAPASGTIAGRTVDPSRWAATFCAALSDYQSAADHAKSVVQGVLDDGVADSSAANEARKTIVDELKTTSSAATKAAKEIAGAGDPDVANGKKIESSLVSAMKSLATVFTSARSTALGLPTGSPSKFRSKVDALSKSVDKGLAKVRKTLADLGTLDKNGELDAALTSESSCAGITGSSG